jgi:hypothetical protein
VVKTSALAGGRRAEFERDKVESNRRYDMAFDLVLSHTTPAEQEAFWRPFGVGVEGDKRSGASARHLEDAEWKPVRPLNDAVAVENPMKQQQRGQPPQLELEPTVAHL